MRSIFELLESNYQQGVLISQENLVAGFTNPLKVCDPQHVGKAERSAEKIKEQMTNGRLHLCWKRNPDNYRWNCRPNMMFCREPEKVILPDPGQYTVLISWFRAEADLVLQLAGSAKEYLEGDLHTLIAERTGLPRQQAKIAFYQMIYGIKKSNIDVQAVSKLFPEIVDYINYVESQIAGVGALTPRGSVVKAPKPLQKNAEGEILENPVYYGSISKFTQIVITEIFDRWLERLNFDLAFYYHDSALLLIPTLVPIQDVYYHVRETLQATLGEMKRTLPEDFQMRYEMTIFPWDSEHRSKGVVKQN